MEETEQPTPQNIQKVDSPDQSDPNLAKEDEKSPKPKLSYQEYLHIDGYEDDENMWEEILDFNDSKTKTKSNTQNSKNIPNKEA
mmetsp:Transcript_25723/g.22825  ORF Transcript_25723/g.22825 Transcript_25723/m.22825 type:complete len:84 (-) Transcript_25723:105-356(-)